MSKFNPAVWLNNRSRVFSESSLEESLAGVNNASQSTLDVGTGSNRELSVGTDPLSPTAASISGRSPSSKMMNLKVSESPKNVNVSSVTDDVLRRWQTQNESRGNLHPTGHHQLHQEQSGTTMRSSKSHFRHMSMPMVSHTDVDHRRSFRDFERAPYAAHNEIYRQTGSKDDDSSSRNNGNDGIIGRNESFGCSSCISGLSADETHFDDGRSVKSSDTFNQYRHRMGPLPELADNDGDISKGRDFGNAFDHLIGTGREFEDDMRNCYRVKTNTNQPKKKYYNSSVQRPSHLRAQSDTMAYRPPTATTLSSNYNMQYLKPKVPAHATLRERISTSNSNLPKPQILQTRSTSNTVQSNSTTSSANNVDNTRNGGSGVVWNGQSDRLGNTLLSVPSVGTGSAGFNSSFDPSEELTTSASYHNGYQKHNELLGTRQRRPFHTPNNSRAHDDFEEKSLQDVPEDDPSTKWADSKSTDGRSILSGASTAASGQRKRVVRDEIKFIMTRFVPARFRHMRSNNRSVTLERSEGCLT